MRNGFGIEENGAFGHEREYCGESPASMQMRLGSPPLGWNDSARTREGARPAPSGPHRPLNLMAAKSPAAGSPTRRAQS